jgi:small-conductance mechanosensitive channel
VVLFVSSRNIGFYIAPRLRRVNAATLPARAALLQGADEKEGARLPGIITADRAVPGVSNARRAGRRTAAGRCSAPRWPGEHLSAVDVLGIRLLGVNAQTLHKLLLSAVIVVVAIVVRLGLRKLEGALDVEASKRVIWTEKTIRLLVGAAAVFFIASIWFEDAHNLAIFSGLVAGGLAIASQRVLQAIAGFFVIVFGRAFNLGDRIEMGGVRGDVIDIGLLKTTVMEMGIPAKVQPDPSHWVAARQYTGRVVTVVNSEVFEKPVFNYSRSFDFVWDEISLPIKYGTDLRVVEHVALDATRPLTADIVREAEQQLEKIKHRYILGGAADLEPRTYVRLTDNWVEVTVRFIARPAGVRELKDRISRRLLSGLQSAGLEIASSTFEIVGLPTLPVRVEGVPDEGEETQASDIQ